MQAAWYDGSMQPIDPPPLSSAVTHGVGLFETMRFYEGKNPRPGKHIERLTRSARGLRLPVPEPPALESTILAAADTDADLRLRIEITWEENPLKGIPERPLVLIQTEPVTRDDPGERPAVRAALVDVRVDEGSPLAGMKTCSFGKNVAALWKARAIGCEQALMTNSKGVICEAATANIFLVVGDRLVTPRPDTGCIAGLTREAVIRIAENQGLVVEESVSVRTDALEEAREVFLTSSVREIVQLREVVLQETRVEYDWGPSSTGADLARLYREDVLKGAAG